MTGVTRSGNDGGQQAAWAAAIEAWTAWLLASARPQTTIDLRRYQIGRVAAGLGWPDPWTVDLEQLVAWLASHDHWKPETRRGYRAALRTFYTWARAVGHVEVSPADQLPTVKVPKRYARPTPADILSNALVAADSRTRLMVNLAAYAGLRRGEIARVHTDDVLPDPEGGWMLVVHGKGDKDRLVPLAPRIAAELRAAPPGWVFPSPRGGHLTPRYVGDLVGDLMPPGWTCHPLRHRFATRAFAGERDLTAVQELLGHASIETTRIYVQTPPGATRRAVEAASA